MGSKGPDVVRRSIFFFIVGTRGAERKTSRNMASDDPGMLLLSYWCWVLDLGCRKFLSAYDGLLLWNVGQNCRVAARRSFVQLASFSISEGSLYNLRPVALV